jgi:hypothetical protein
MLTDDGVFVEVRSRERAEDDAAERLPAIVDDGDRQSRFWRRSRLVLRGRREGGCLGGRPR